MQAGRLAGYMKPAAILFVVLVLIIVWQTGLLQLVADPHRLAQTMLAARLWGYVGFILAYALLQPFGVPGTVFIIAAPLIWSWQVAFVLSMLGTMLASLVGFSFARFVAKDWVLAHMPVRFHKYNDALEKRALQTVFLLRLIFWMPQALHAFFGVSKVSFWTHFWGSFIGYLPTLLVISYLGTELFDSGGAIRTDAWPIFAGLLAASLFMVLLTRMCRQKHSLF